MKRMAILCTLISLTFASSQACAQGHEPQRERDDRGAAPHGEQGRPQERQARRAPQGHDQREWARGDRQDDRGAGPQHAFRRGGRLPGHYQQRQYVVDDWQARRLSRPPRGYQWVQTGNDYVLVAIATGIILQLMLNN